MEASSTENSVHPGSGETKRHHLLIIITLIWTAAIGCSFGWNTYNERQTVRHVARKEALASFEKDVVYRLWNSQHGGVYAPVTESTQPNPYLTRVTERDIQTPSGRKYTLINPAYMTRQVHELGFRELGARSHITSLNPIRPANVPDLWEEKALKSFELGREEAVGQFDFDGSPYLRFMRPLITKEACLKCHAEQGYQVGDIRGGISVAVPLSPYLAIAREDTAALALAHGGLWILGLAGIGLGRRSLRKYEQARDASRAALAEKTSLLNSVLVSSTDFAIATTDLDLHLTYSNPLAEDLFGEPSEEAIVKAVTGMPPTEGRAQKLLRQAFKTVSTSGEFRFCTRQTTEGGVRELDSRLTGVSNEQGKLIGYALFSRDVTERNAMQRELEQAKEKWERTFDSVPDLISIIDTNHRIMRVNRAVTKRMGLPAEQIVGMDCHTCFHGATAMPPDCPRELRLNPNDPFQERVCENHLGGHFLITVSPLRDNKGELQGFVHVARDITDKILGDKQRQRQHAFTQSIIENAAEGICVFHAVKDDPGIECTVWNPCMEEITGYTMEEINAQGWYEAVYQDSDQRQMSRARMASILQGNDVSGMESEICRKDGARRTILTVTSLLAGETDPPDILALVTDVTERKQEEKTLATRVRQQAAVAQLGGLALSERDASELMNPIVEAVASNLGVEYCKILELLPDAEGMLLRTGVGWQDGLAGKAIMPIGEDSQAGYTLQSRGPVIVENLRTEARFSGPQLLRDHNVVSGLSLIVGPQERPWGILGVHTAHQRVFSEDDVNFLQAVANLLFYAVERTRAEQELGHYAKRQQELLREVNHRVKNNLAAIISMLHLEEDRVQEQGGTSSLDRLEDLTSRVRSLSTAHSMLSGSHWGPLRVCELTREILRAAMGGAPPSKHIDIDVAACDTTVDSDIAHHLALVFNELAINTLKYALGERDEVRIHVRFESAPERSIAIYRDDGPGYPTDILQGGHSASGIGLGLVSGIIRQSLYGEVNLSNDGGAVTRIEFENRRADKRPKG